MFTTGVPQGVCMRGVLAPRKRIEVIKPHWVPAKGRACCEDRRLVWNAWNVSCSRPLFHMSAHESADAVAMMSDNARAQPDARLFGHASSVAVALVSAFARKLTDARYCYNDDAGGVYTYFRRDIAAAPAAASAFSGGSTALVGGVCLAAGATAGAGATALAYRRRKGGEAA